LENTTYPIVDIGNGIQCLQIREACIEDLADLILLPMSCQSRLSAREGWHILFFEYFIHDGAFVDTEMMVIDFILLLPGLCTEEARERTLC